MVHLDGTTIVAVKKGGKTVIAGDGQVTQSQSMILKGNAVKVRRLFDGKVVAGFAGSVADAFTLCGRFEDMLNKYGGNLTRSAVELAQLWRSDKMLRQLEAMLIVADADDLLIVSGNGDVIEPENGICAIGSGGAYALSAARALSENTKLTARQIAEKAMKIAADVCVYTNGNFIIEEI